MRSRFLVHMFACLICSFVSISFLFSQSTDRKNPSPLQSRIISGVSSPTGAVYWYKLTAGPGELTINMTVAGSSHSGLGRSGGRTQFVLYNKDMQEVINELVSGDPYTEGGRKNISLSLQRKHDLLLSIKPVGGTYMIQFKGAIDLPPEKEEQ